MEIHASSRLQHARSVEPVLARRALAVFVAAHGLAHLVGTSHAFSLAADGRSLGYVAGNWRVSDPTTMRIFGVLWALIALAFVLTAVVIWLGRTGWPLLLWWVSLASLLLVLVALWAAVIGVVVDLALLAVAWRAGAFSRDRSRA